MRARETSGANGRPAGFREQAVAPLPLEVHTQEQLDAYLDAVAQGVGLDLAARQIDSTSTKMRRLLARDPEWQARLDAAIVQGKEHYADRLKATARVIALRTDPAEVVPRILEVELATHAPGYEHLRRDRVKHEGHVTHGVTIQLPELATLDELPVEVRAELLAVLEKVAEHRGEIVDAEVRELPAA